MTANETIIYLIQKSEEEGGLSPENTRKLNDLMQEAIDAADTTKEEVKESAGVVDEKKAGLLSRAWSCTVGMARKVWNAIWSFFCMIGRGIKKAAKSVGGGVKGLFSKKPEAAAKQTIDVKAEKVA